MTGPISVAPVLVPQAWDTQKEERGSGPRRCAQHQRGERGWSPGFCGQGEGRHREGGAYGKGSARKGQDIDWSCQEGRSERGSCLGGSPERLKPGGRGLGEGARLCTWAAGGRLRGQPAPSATNEMLYLHRVCPALAGEERLVAGGLEEAEGPAES